MPNLKDFTLIFSEGPRYLEKLAQIDPGTVTHAILSNLSLIRKDQIRNIHLHLTDYYEHPTFPMSLPSRCTSASELWKSIGETLVAMAQAINLKINMHAIIKATVETDNWELYPSQTIKDWFAKHVVTSPADREKITVGASMRCSNGINYIKEYYHASK